MKKVLSCLLAAVIAFSALGIAASAAENYESAYFVTVAPDYEEMIAICDAVETDIYGQPVVLGIQYFQPRSQFKFKVVALGGYQFDQTTGIKVGPVSYLSDIAMSGTDERSYIIYPDEYGIYTIDSVDEDLYIYAVNMDEGTIASVKDLVINLINAILKFFKWLFGIVTPTA